MSEGGTSACQTKTTPRRAKARAVERAGARADGLDSSGQGLVLRTVEQAVLPVLRGKALSDRKDRRAAGERPHWADCVAEAVRLSLGSDDQALGSYVDGLHRGGETASTLYDSLLTPVARRLGVMWEEDTTSFADLTMGMVRLQAVQRALSAAFRTGRVAGDRRVLLMPVPGEHHVFGLSIVADYFAQAGWDAQVVMPRSRVAACRLVRRSKARLVGLTLGCDERVEMAAGLVAALRKAVPGLRVLAGGPSVVADPGLAVRIGADAGCSTGQQAVAQADSWAGVGVGAHG